MSQKCASCRRQLSDCQLSSVRAIRAEAVRLLSVLTAELSGLDLALPDCMLPVLSGLEKSKPSSAGPCSLKRSSELYSWTATSSTSFVLSELEHFAPCCTLCRVTCSASSPRGTAGCSTLEKALKTQAWLRADWTGQASLPSCWPPKPAWHPCRALWKQVCFHLCRHYKHHKL